MIHHSDAPRGNEHGQLTDLLLHAAGLGFLGLYAGIIGSLLLLVSFLYSAIERKLIRARAELSHLRREIQDSCLDCHTPLRGTAANKCITCHVHLPRSVAREHREEGIRDFDACETCHRSGEEHGKSACVLILRPVLRPGMVS